jgi:hypothetical protein
MVTNWQISATPRTRKVIIALMATALEGAAAVGGFVSEV